MDSYIRDLQQHACFSFNYECSEWYLFIPLKRFMNELICDTNPFFPLIYNYEPLLRNKFSWSFVKSDIIRKLNISFQPHICKHIFIPLMSTWRSYISIVNLKKLYIVKEAKKTLIEILITCYHFAHLLQERHNSKIMFFELRTA